MARPRLNLAPVVPRPEPSRPHVTCTAATPPRPRWPRPKLAPPPTLQ
jgi:hypothetical protein